MDVKLIDQIKYPPASRAPLDDSGGVKYIFASR
jgi:hypothetical protein